MGGGGVGAGGQLEGILFNRNVWSIYESKKC